jgi:hypothetical protein
MQDALAMFFFVDEEEKPKCCRHCLYLSLLLCISDIPTLGGKKCTCKKKKK